MPSGIDKRLAHLEAQRAARSLPACPGYLAGRDLDDLAAQVRTLRGQGYTGRLTGYLGLSPDDWDVIQRPGAAREP